MVAAANENQILYLVLLPADNERILTYANFVLQYAGGVIRFDEFVEKIRSVFRYYLAVVLTRQELDKYKVKPVAFQIKGDNVLFAAA